MSLDDDETINIRTYLYIVWFRGQLILNLNMNINMINDMRTMPLLASCFLYLYVRTSLNNRSSVVNK